MEAKGGNIPFNKRALSVDESREYIGGLSLPKLYDLMGEKTIQSFKIGRRRFILRSELDKYIDSRLEAGDGL